MKLKFNFLLIVGLILTSCSSTAQEPDFTYDSNETTTIDTKNEIHSDATVDIEKDTQVDSNIYTEKEIHPDTSSAETSEQAENTTGDSTRSESYVQSIVSPNGEYVLIPTSVTYDNSQNIVYNSLCLTKVDDNTEIASLNETFYDISVEWSPDSNYAAVKEIDQNRQYSDTIMVFDISIGTVLSMPRLEIQNRIQAEISDTVNLYSCDLLSCEWEDNHTLKVNFDIKTGVSFYSKSHLGYYTFDLENGSITTLEYDDIAANTPKTTSLTEDEIKAVINENLDILMLDSDEFYSEKAFIDAHPNAFENIILLGEAALPYLKEIGNGYNFIGEDTSENNRCYIAKAAEYVIKPDIYDSVFPSLDGQYAIKTTVNSFFYLADPFRDIKYNLKMIKTENNEVLLTTNEAYCLYSDPFADANIQWSPDSKYAFFKDEYRHMYTYIHIFDTTNSVFYTLPKERELEEILGTKLEYTDESGRLLDNLHCYIEKWENNNVKVRIVLSDSAIEGETIGWYLYDLENRNIVNIEIYDIINT